MEDPEEIVTEVIVTEVIAKEDTDAVIWVMLVQRKVVLLANLLQLSVAASGVVVVLHLPRPRTLMAWRVRCGEGGLSRSGNQFSTVLRLLLRPLCYRRQSNDSARTHIQYLEIQKNYSS